jgi:hypothetical protein
MGAAVPDFYGDLEAGDCNVPLGPARQIGHIDRAEQKTNSSADLRETGLSVSSTSRPATRD